MKIIFFIIFTLKAFFILSSCSSPAHVRAAEKIMNSFTQEVRREGLYQKKSGGSMRGDIKEIILGYTVYRSLKLNQARLLFIKVSEALLNKINSNDEIRSYLHNYPFEVKNISLSLSFSSPKEDYLDESYISYVFLNTLNEDVVYCIYDSLYKELKVIHQEPYQDALRIYQESMNP